MIYALLVIPYLLIGLFITRIVWHNGPGKNGSRMDSDDLTVLSIVAVLWPLVSVVGVGWGFAQLIKVFVTFDTKTWRARRRTQRIERELDK